MIGYSSGFRQVANVSSTFFHFTYLMLFLRCNLQVKSQIHTAVSRQLETLRSREVWLLSQVDVIESAKTGVLTQQEEQLNRALGTLHGSLEMYPKQSSLSQLDNKLSESIERYTYSF